jgi:hypothetical protein
MRRLLHATLILAVAAVIPATAIAALCGGAAMSCCAGSEAADPSLSRPGCCAAPCFEAAPERPEPASETRAPWVTSPDGPLADAPVAALVVPAAPVLEIAPMVSPPLGRRLASLSTLLI